LTFKGKSQYQTTFGAIITAVCGIILVIFMAVKGYEVSIQPIFHRTGVNSHHDEVIVIPGGQPSLF
jgi:hypothetical protein